MNLKLLVVGFLLIVSFNISSSSAQIVKMSSGTGFYINGNGDFITNAHVVKKCTKIVVGQKKNVNIPATIRLIDKEKDIALLRTKKMPNSVAPLRFDTRYNVGDKVLVIGYPGQAGITRENVIKHAKIVNTKGFNNQPGWIQITNEISKGNSGGPLLDIKGNVIGVVSGIMSKISHTGQLYEQVGVAISLPVLKKFLDSNYVHYSQRIYMEIPFFKNQVEELANKFIYNVNCI